MSISATKYFEFLDNKQEFNIERLEVVSQLFGIFRRYVRSMIISFRESDNNESQELADYFQSALSSWLTTPIQFDSSLFDVFKILGDPIYVEKRWGRDLSSNLEEARRCAIELQMMENPICVKLKQEITALSSCNRKFRIYCHKRTKEYYDLLLCNQELHIDDTNLYIHSVADYHNSEPFDVLIKIGPLRSYGWGSAPNALLTSPRYQTLFQIVWSGCKDEPGFGYDPLSSSVMKIKEAEKDNISDNKSENLGFYWNMKKETFYNDGLESSVFQDLDDLKILSEMNEKRDVTSAILVQIDANHCILYPRLSQVLSFDPNAQEPISYRLSGETLSVGMSIILPILDDTELSGEIAKEGYYSKYWKEKLAEEFRNNRKDLIHRLRAAGLELITLESRIEHWCKPTTTVIPAPSLSSHFKILIEVLGVKFPEKLGRPFQHAMWQYAWDEVRRSRGEAIQLGFHEQQIMDQQLLDLIHSVEPEIRSRSLLFNLFQLKIPEGSSVSGVFRVYRVISVERGYRVPPANLRTIIEIEAVNQWQE